MLLQGPGRQLTGYVGILLLAVLIVGCTGAPDSSGGGGSSPTSVVSIVADPGRIVAVRVGGQATLDGRLSRSSNGESLIYDWSFLARPDLSNAQLISPTSQRPSFIADVTGTYKVQLVVRAGSLISEPAIATVVVTNPGEDPTGPFNHPGLSYNCVTCHDGTPTGAIGKSGDHIASTNECQACHTPLGFTVITFVDHRDVFGNCSTCHDGITAIGQSDSHIPTNEECNDCHNTTSFLELGLDGSFDHTGINQNCGRCHNGITASGKDADHIVTDGDCVSCHTTDSFIPAIGVDHTALPPDQVCGDCHNGVDATGKDSAQNHITTTADCRNCHNIVDFADAFVDHTGPEVLNAPSCDSCHDNVNGTATGKPENHMPTTLDCGVCHTPGTFASGVFDHSGDVSDCTSCHDGVISTGKPADHIPTTQNCSVCHGSTVSFTQNLTFDHAGIVDNCASCHDGTTSVGKPDNHIPTQDDCSVCHSDTNTGGFVNSSFLSTEHPNIDSGCEGCHNSNILGAGFVQANDHVPTEQDCYICHTNTAFTPASNFDHTGISNNCESCHDGSFENIGARGKNGVTQHPVTNEDCGSCHNTTNFADAFVDHTSPEVLNQRCDNCHGVTAIGKDADHLPTTEDCRVCHVPGNFAAAAFDHTGIVDNCQSCHNGTDATGKTPDHIPTTQDCSVCHNTTSFASATFDHQGIVDNCESCHNGTTATGKPNDHVPTNNDCHVCHETTGFLPATFDHQGIVDNCASCHDGVLSTGKPNDHVPTNQDCGVCHNTNGFIPATFDHTGIVDNCASCHNGVDATGKTPDHIDTNLDCSNCHTTATFVGASWDHEGITGNCVSCHDGSSATGQGRDHFNTTEDCNACHVTTGWAPVDYNHPNSSDYPGDHNGNVGCISCHRQNDQTISYRFPQYAGTCASCHANDFDAGEHRGGLDANLNCGNSGCHRVSDRNWD
ncbi:MAG: hypothetical protein PVG89_12710 [Gammaproteobacteria bacterium]|jgi:hypothetical protein